MNISQIDKITLELGEIVLLSQLIESHLSSILLFLKNKDNLSIGDADLKLQHKKLSKHTLGTLRNLLIKNEFFSDTESSLIVMEDCRVERNFLMHELSSYYGGDFNTKYGRAKILKRIKQGKAKMLLGANFVKNLMEQVVTLCGQDPDLMKVEIQKNFE